MRRPWRNAKDKLPEHQILQSANVESIIKLRVFIVNSEINVFYLGSHSLSAQVEKLLTKRFDVEEFGEVGIISLHEQLHVQ